MRQILRSCPVFRATDKGMIMERIRVRFLIVRKKVVGLCLLLAAAFAVLVFSTVKTESAAVFLGYTSRQLPVYNVGTEEKKVAVSFDAAWGDDNTEGILQALNGQGVKATFFLVGFWTRKYPELVKRLDGSGMELGTHSNTHPYMTKLDDTKLDLELSASKSSITEITGKEVGLFRAPFGDYSDKVLNACKRASLTAIQWDVDSYDWKELSAKQMAERVLSRVKAGSIVLFHTDGKYTAEALPAILMGLKNKGYQVTTVGDLLLKDNYYIDHAGTMRNKNG